MTTHVKAFSGAFALALIPFISAKADYTLAAGTKDAAWESAWTGDSGNYVINYESPNAAITFNSAAAIATGFWIENADGLVHFAAADSTYGLTETTGEMHIGGINYGFLQIDSGTYSFDDDLYVAYSQAWWANPNPTTKGSLTIAGGAVSVGNSVILGNITGSLGQLYLSGGTLSTKTVVAGEGSGEVEFWGGTLKATADGSLIGSGLTVSVGENSTGTIDTQGYAITIDSAIGGSGTLTLTGGGSVTFTVNPTCGISIDSESAPKVVYPSKNTWTGAAGDNDWANGSNWSTGSAPASADDEAVIPDGSTVVLSAAATVGTLTIDGTVTLTTGDYYLSMNSITGDADDLLILSGAKIKGVAGENTISVPLQIATSTENTLYTDHIGNNWGAGIAVSSAISGDGTLIIDAYAAKANGSNVNAGVSLSGDNSAFTGTIEYRVGSYNGGYQARQRDTLAAASSSEDADWVFYTNMTGTPARNSGTLFPTANGTYKFGSAQINLPHAGYAVASGVTFEIGKKDTDSAISGPWNNTPAINWVAASATLSNSATGTGSITLSGGGNVSMTSDGVPTALNFTDAGGYLVLTDDDTLNASIISAITTVDDGATVGFYYDGETTIAIDLSDKASLLAGKTVAKKGTGTIYVNGLPSETVSNVEVNGGTMILPHGVAVGTVAVASGAVLNVDMSGAADGETVFAFTSISGEGTVEETNLSSRTQLTKGEASWTATILGDPVAYTWCGLQGDDWSTPGNWMTNGVVTSDIPTASDTAEFTADATLTSSSAITTPVTVSAGTLTVSTGMTFASLTVAEGAKIAFSNASIAAVGDTLALITVNGGTFTADDCTIPSNYTYTLTDGVLVATRAQSTYTWAPQGEDTGWATSGNWTVEGSAVAEVPALEDYVVFPASTEEEAWTVTLPWDVYATTMTLNTNVTVSGGYSLRCPAIGGEGQLRLAGAHLNAYEGAITVSCPLHIVENTSNTIWLSGNNVYITGALTGSGTLISNAGGKQYTGVKFSGDVSGFAGTFEATNYSQRDATDMTDPAIGSENAVWKTNPHPGTGTAQQATQFIVHSNETVYKFGAYVGGFWVGEIDTPHLEIGNRSDVASSFGLSSYGSRGRYVITKVGSGEMTITNEKGDPQIGTLYPNGGTTIIKTTPGAITFNGDGKIKTPAYDVTENEVTSSYYPDVSSKITGSTGPIAFTNDEGEEHTWAALDSTSNTGGLSKYGSGKLTITTKMGYEGITSVFDDGVLEIDTALNKTFDADYPVNALSTGTITGAAVTAYAYPAGTTLDGTETADDYLKVLNNNSSEALVASLDFSGVTTVDVSAQDLYDEENNKLKNFVLARTTGAITGIGKVGNGLTLIVPDCPDGVAEGKWVWTVRTTVETVDNVTYHCVTVTPKALPFVISIQ